MSGIKDHKAQNYRKKKMKKKTIRLLKKLSLPAVIVLVVILLVSCTVNSCSDAKEEKKRQEEQAKLQAEKEREQAEAEARQKEIDAINQAAKEAGAPDGILELIAKNEETIDFVKDYPEKKDLAAAETIGQELTDGVIPHLLQWDEGWGYQPYGVSTVASSGCGPTCMSMVIAGLTGDETVTPYVMAQFAEESGYMIAEGGTYAEFMRYAAEQKGLYVQESPESEEFVAQELAQGHPIVCNLGPGKHFTDVGHFIVLTSYEDGMVSVNDPFSIANTEKKWDYKEFKEQILGMWSYAQ